MYRASRAQHSIPEQQHYVDKGVVQGGWGQEHVFLSERNELNWRAVLLMNTQLTTSLTVSCELGLIETTEPTGVQEKIRKRGVRTTR